MEQDAFDLLARGERDHWWFRGRRLFIEAALASLSLPSGAALLDAGCGVGGNLALLAQHGAVYGFETDAAALEAARQRGLGPVEYGCLPEPIPFAPVSFHAIGLFDVLEHVEHPVEALSALGDRLHEQGALVITVPAIPWLWGPHDEHHHHFRRYTATSLRAQLEAAGLEVVYLTSLNLLLLPLAILQRIKERLLGYRPESLNPSPFVNGLLFAIWRIERRWIPRRRLPLGLSLLAIARRKGTRAAGASA